MTKMYCVKRVKIILKEILYEICKISIKMFLIFKNQKKRESLVLQNERRNYTQLSFLCLKAQAKFNKSCGHGSVLFAFSFF